MTDDRSGLPRAWLPVLAVAAAVLVASLLPLPESGAEDASVPWVTALGHLVGYAALAATTTRAQSISPVAGPGSPTRSAVHAAAAVAATIAFGLAVELLQVPVPTRGFAVADLAVNAVGAVLGAGAYVHRSDPAAGSTI